VGLIRRGGFTTACPFSFSDLEASADRILADARAEAERILSGARAEAAALREKQRREGYETGLAEGRRIGEQRVVEETRAAALEKARADMARTSAALLRALVTFDEGRRRLLAEAESGLIAVAVAVADRVCRLKAAQGAEVAVEAVRGTLELMRHERDVEIRLHPADAEQMRDLAPELAAGADGLEHLSITGDESLSRGDCVLRTRHGQVDARLATQLDRIAAALVTPPPAAPSEGAS